MYPVSEAYKKAIEGNTRKYYWTGTITAKNGKTYEFSNENIVILLFISDVRCLYSSRTADFNRP